VGITVEFKGGKEPPLQLKHALSFDDGGQWTEIALPIAPAAEGPRKKEKKKEKKKMETKQRDQLFSTIVTNEPKARLQVRHRT
jgi:hypothetical protein